MSDTRRYSAFGLIISSCLELPELLPETGAGAADVTVRYGEVPAELPEASRFVHGDCQTGPGQVLFEVSGVARFLAQDGREIVIDRRSGATDDDIRVFVLGSAIGAVMQQ